MLNSDPAIDIALFGRMVADDPKLNEDASSQVAHAISTHGVQTEFDFFTATMTFPRQTMPVPVCRHHRVQFGHPVSYAMLPFMSFRQIEDSSLVVNIIKLFVGLCQVNAYWESEHFYQTRLPRPSWSVCIDQPSAWSAHLSGQSPLLTATWSNLSSGEEEYESVIRWVRGTTILCEFGHRWFVGINVL